jgi:DNA-binding FadR family transcriptional regulator
MLTGIIQYFNDSHKVKAMGRSTPVTVDAAAVPRGTAGAQIAGQLCAQLADGRLRPGDRLPPLKHLAATFGVSVGTMREAVSALVHAGMLESLVGVGTFVRQPLDLEAARVAWLALPESESDFLEFLEARKVLEPCLASLAARRATPEQVERLRQMAAAISEALAAIARASSDVRQRDRLAEIDVQFHDAVAEAAGNRPLRRALQVIYQPLQVHYARFGRRLSPEEMDMWAGWRRHVQLVDALAAGDAARAAELAHQIVTLTESWHLTLGPGQGTSEGSAADTVDGDSAGGAGTDLSEVG